MKRQEDRTLVDPTHWWAGGGVMGELIGNKDWAGSDLGGLNEWPASLRTALGIGFAFPAPACIVWGQQRAQLYNDAYAQLSVMGHSDALGEDFAHSWSQAWPSLRACFERALRGEPTRLEDQQVSFERDGATEAAVVTFSFAPIHDEAGGVGGLLVTLLEPSSSQLREELARTKADLEQHGHVISHDFRAPLRTLEQMSRIVLNEHAAQLPAGALGLLNHVANGAAKLALRADTLARVDVLSHHPLHRQDIDVGAMVRKVMAEVQSAAPERQVEVVVEDLPRANADYELLRLVLSNLLSNAFKFTRNAEHARIEVSGRQQGHHVVYSVKDNGVGFDPQYARRLFGFFQRMHTEAEFEGLGMGLALTKRLIERHGGSIWVEAEKGRGAEFRFTLPA
ncbi:sensor histidine kinase [Steroidobacter sp.]|uniref:sensor histidine kinase n=1 Tax=Steroidobacter sp. TaxID=1978227 RepID=UPI001A4CFCD6|nr:ATP-binding protein [Steroidobacter sp.]MBL8266186.1 PAS domain-containing protein [Steroidobacter sp.]